MSTMQEAEAQRKQGNAHLSAGDLLAAAECYEQAARVSPQLVAAWVALGYVHMQLGKLDLARSALEQAIRLDIGEVDAKYLLGTIAIQQGSVSEAVSLFKDAIETRPTFSEAHFALGTAYRKQRQLLQALACLDRAITLNPDFNEALVAKALVLMMQQKFREGLPLYENRLLHPESSHLAQWIGFLAAHPEKARWHGEPLNGRRLLIWVEEGLGDCLMIMRFLSQLRARGAGKVIVLSDPAIMRVFQSLPTVDEVTCQVEGPPLNSFDLHCPIMSLPKVLGLEGTVIPHGVPYVQVPTAARQHWAGWLDRYPGLKVGLCWAGNPKFANDASRSVPLHLLTPLLGIEGFTLVSLQKSGGKDQLRAAQMSVLDRMDECADFFDTAALMSCLDLVVSVDTSVAHMAGALGKPVWLLNRYESEWRWGLDRDDSYWYPTMRIFNQTDTRDWRNVIAAVTRALQAIPQQAKR